MKIGTTPLLSIALAISFLVGAFPVIAGAGDDGSNNPPSRKAGEDLIVENRTVILDENEEFKTIKIRKDGHLIIKGVMIQAEELVCRADQTNTSFTIVGDRTLAFLRLTKGILDVKADNIVFNEAVVTVDNKNTTVVGEKDVASRMTLISRGVLSITNSTITVSGQDGKPGDKQNYGFAGGPATLGLQSIGKGVLIQKTDIKVLGGKGGDNYNPGMRGGDGGDSVAMISGESILIDRCPWNGSAGIRILAGDVGGSASAGNAKNGAASLIFDATNDIVVKASEIEAASGTTTGAEDQSVIRVVSKKGSFLIDHQKTGQDRYLTLTKLITGTTIIVDVPVAAELHEVDVGLTAIYGNNAPVRSMWWAFVQVRDVYGQVLKEADVKWYQGMDLTPYPKNGTAMVTNETGWIEVEVDGRIGRASSSDKIRYKFEALIYGGATARSEETVFEDPVTKVGSNKKIAIDITRIDLVVATINSEPFVSGMLVGGVIIFEGTAQTMSDLDIEKVSLYDIKETGEIEMGKGVNLAISTAPAFSLWKLTIDTEKFSQGRHELAMVVSDKFYTVRLVFELVFDFQAVNHKPILTGLDIHHALGTNATTPKNQVEVHVTNDNPVITVYGQAYDRDYASTKLVKGKKIASAVISIRDQGEDVYFEKTLSDDDFQKKNETGGYNFKFEVDLSKKMITATDYEEGLYTLTILLKDDAGFMSVDSWVTLDVSWDYYPRIDLQIDDVDPPSLDDRLFAEPTWKSLTTVESDELPVVFNLTKCNDQDSPNFASGQSWKDLSFKVVIKIDGGQEETAYEGSGNPSFGYSFDVRDIPDGEEGIFSIKVTATDKEGLSTEKLYKARVIHDPPVLPNSLIGKIAGSEDTGVDIGAGIFGYIALLVIGILAYLGLLLFNMARINKEKSRKIDMIEKLKAEEKKQQKSVVEDEVRSGASAKSAIKPTSTLPSIIPKTQTPLPNAAPAPALKPATAPLPSAPRSPVPIRPATAPIVKTATPPAVPPARPPAALPQSPPKAPPLAPPPIPGPPAPPKAN